MPSFDLVSKIDLQELDNAVNQTKKELASRYDFQGTNTELTLAPDKQTILLKANDQGRLDAAYEVLMTKMGKRGVSLRGLTREKAEQAALGLMKQLIKLQQGVPVEKAKELIKILKDSKLKVTASIQGDQLRVSGKSRDSLQEAIALFRQQQDALGLDMQFVNLRD